MRFELFVALRYLFARTGQAFISVISWISVAGVALGVASLIVVMGVMNGFTTDLRDKIIGMTSHAVIYSIEGRIADNPDIISTIDSVSGVVAATPFIHSGVLLSGRSGGSGVYLRGIEPKSAPKVLGGLKKTSPGAIEALEAVTEDDLPGIIVGEGLARKIGARIGGRVNLMAPTGQQSSAGYTPRIMPFEVVGTFSVGLADYDNSLAFVTIPMAREVLGWQEDVVSGIEVAVNDVYQAPQIVHEALELLDNGSYYANTWMEMNANLFAALKLEKAAMAIILTLVVLVGSFSIITALVMLVMEKTRDIAIMMSMGATTGMIRRIFIVQGVIIGFMGTTIGFVLGLGVCFLLKRYKFIELPKGVYSLDYLPVLLEWPDIAMTAVGAMLLCFFATLYPARQASRLEPVEALRHE